jgi:hypothetical protein
MPIPIEQMKPDERIFALFVGDSGAGKTSTLPWFSGRKLDLDIDRRWKGLLGHKDPKPFEKEKQKIPLTEIDIHQFEGKDLQQEIEKWLGDWEGKLVRRETFPWSTVYFDGFTSYNQLICKQAMEIIGSLGGRTNTGEKSAGNKSFGNVNLMGWDAFAYQLQCFSNTITNLKYILPSNVICTAHWTDKYEEGQVVGKDIDLRKRVVNEIILWFDEVYFFEKKTSNVLSSTGEAKIETKHIVHFRNDIARTTFPLLPDSVDWTGRNFYDILMKGRKGEL